MAKPLAAKRGRKLTTFGESKRVPLDFEGLGKVELRASGSAGRFVLVPFEVGINFGMGFGFELELASHGQ